MAAAPLRDIVAAEAVGAVGVGAALLVWTGAAAARLELPPVPASWAAVRVVAVLLIGLGTLLWAVRARVAEDPGGGPGARGRARGGGGRTRAPADCRLGYVRGVRRRTGPAGARGPLRALRLAGSCGRPRHAWRLTNR